MNTPPTPPSTPPPNPPSSRSTRRRPSAATPNEPPPSDPAGPFLIWAIDDGPSHLERIARTFNALAAPEIVLETWLDGLLAAEAYDRRLAEGDLSALPRVVFMDFFLGDGLDGGALTRRMVNAYKNRPKIARHAHRPIVIGHSSVPDCSALIAALGGGFCLEKRGLAPISEPIRAAFDTPEKRAYLLKHRKPLAT
ncbi:MAG: hypothetical protein ACREJ2_10370 [Planctomycetota bacterium]